MELDYKKLLIMGIILCLIWGSFLWYLVTYGEKVSESPCQVCADKMGESVICVYGMEQVKFEPGG